MPHPSPRQLQLGWSGIFLVAVTLIPHAAFAAEDDDVAKRAERIANMSSVDKRELLAKQERFNQLSDSEQEQLRRFHDELSAHPEAENLKKVLNRYVTWLSTQNANEQARLQQLPVEQRLERIVELNHDRHDRRLSELGLTEDDANVILDWFVSSVDSNRDSIIEALGIPKSRNGQKYDSRHLRMMIMRRTGDVLDLLPMNALIAQLSSGARDRFYAKDQPEQRRKLLQRWIEVSFQHRFRPTPVSRAELFRRLRNMPAEERARLEQLPPDELEDVLRREFASWPRRHSSHFRRQRGNGEGRRSRGSRRMNQRGPRAPNERDAERGPPPDHHGPPPNRRPPRDGGPPPQNEGPPPEPRPRLD